MLGYGHMGLIGLGFGWIFQLIFLVIIIWAIFSLFRHGRYRDDCCSKSKNGQFGAKQNGNSIEILKNRYAKGEINKEDFEKIKKDLE